MRSIQAFPLIIIFASIILFSCSQEETADTKPIQKLDFSSFANTVPIEDQYIVVFHEEKISGRLIHTDVASMEVSMRREAINLLAKYRIAEDSIQRVYSSVLNGFCAKFDKAKLEQIKNDPLVKYVEQDRGGMLGEFPVKPLANGDSDPINTQIVPWGIKRVGGPFAYSGKNSVYVVDTGIQLDHPDLNVCIEKAFDAYHPVDKKFCFIDEHGHGTHVAGTIGALDNFFGVVGVAAGIPLVPVKIFFGPFAQYSYSGMIAGIGHVGKKGIPGDVANFSF